MPREIITSVEPPAPQRALPCLGSPTQVVSDEFVTISRFDDAPLEEEEIEVLRLTKLRPWSRMQLDAAAELILRQSLNGGGSGQSEAMAFEVLTRLHRCRLVGTEDQVKYCRRSPVADMVFEKGAERVGVSVTRVYEYCKKPLVFDSVCDLLGKKRSGLRSACAAAATDWRWHSGVVFVWVANTCALALVLDAWRHVVASEVDWEEEERLADEMHSKGVKELKVLIAEYGFEFNGCVEKSDLVARALVAHNCGREKGRVGLIACHAENMACMF